MNRYQWAWFAMIVAFMFLAMSVLQLWWEFPDTRPFWKPKPEILPPLKFLRPPIITAPIGFEITVSTEVVIEELADLAVTTHSAKSP